MKVKMTQILAIIVCFGISTGLYATELDIWIGCESEMNNNAMFMEYVGTEEYCYRVKVRCDPGLFGWFGVNVNPDDGGVGFGGEVSDGIPHDEGGAACGVWFGHLRNTGFSHSCDFDVGKAELDVKAVHGKKCR